MQKVWFQELFPQVSKETVVYVRVYHINKAPTKISFKRWHEVEDGVMYMYREVCRSPYIHVWTWGSFVGNCQMEVALM